MIPRRTQHRPRLTTLAPAPLLPDPAGAVLLPWLLPFWVWLPLAGAGVAWAAVFPAGAVLLPMAAGCPACGGSSVPAMPVWPVG